MMKVATGIRVHTQLLERRADLRGNALTVVVRRDPARLPHQIEDREIGNCGPERQAATLQRDRARLRRELQSWVSRDLPRPGSPETPTTRPCAGRGAKGLPQRLELLVSSREGVSRWCLVDRGCARAAPDDAQRVDGALVDRHRLCLLKIEVPTQVRRGRGTHQHISGVSRPVQTSCEHGRVTGGGVVHPKVVADRTDDHRTGVDPDPDVDLGSLLHRERGKRGAACVILVSDRGAEEGHEAVAEELVDRALVAVDLREGEREEAVDDAVVLLRAACAASSGERTMSQKRTLTCFRSPSIALRMARIRSLRWRGV